MTDYTVNLTKELELLNSQVVESLEEAAAFSILSDQFSRLREEFALPEPEVVLRFGRAEQVASNVRKGYSGLGAAFSVISMISGFEAYLTRLLLMRRLVESTGSKGALRGEEFKRLRAEVEGESRAAPMRLVKKVVGSPSERLLTGAEWLEGVYRVRVCLTHRGGRVDARDINEDGVLAVKWRRAQLHVGEKLLDHLPFQAEAGERISVRFVDDNRRWRPGDRIQVTPEDCQHMAFSLAFLAGWLKEELHTEIQQLLGQGQNQS